MLQVALIAGFAASFNSVHGAGPEASGLLESRGGGQLQSRVVPPSLYVQYVILSINCRRWVFSSVPFMIN
jgi:hypothetical protein